MKSTGLLCSWCSVLAIPALAVMGCSFEEGSGSEESIAETSEATEEICVLDPVSVSVVGSTQSTIQVEVCVGDSGAPGGFTLEWLPDGSAAGQECSATFGLKLLPNTCETVTLGDFSAESGVCASCSELPCGTEFVVRGRADEGCECQASDFSCPVKGSTQECDGGDQGCTLTQGFWKNHPDDWPVTALTLGSVSYTQAQLLTILHLPVAGNGLIALAHQLIAAKLNIASGVSSSDVSAAVAAADALIGSLVVPPNGGYLHPSVTSSLTDALDDFNNGRTGPGHCEDGDGKDENEKKSR